MKTEPSHNSIVVVIIKYQMCLMCLKGKFYTIWNISIQMVGKLFQFHFLFLSVLGTGVLILVIIYAAMGSILFVTLEGDDDIMGKTVETAVAASKPRTDLVNADMRSRYVKNILTFFKHIKISTRCWYWFSWAILSTYLPILGSLCEFFLRFFFGYQITRNICSCKHSNLYLFKWTIYPYEKTHS